MLEKFAQGIYVVDRGVDEGVSNRRRPLRQASAFHFDSTASLEMWSSFMQGCQPKDELMHSGTTSCQSAWCLVATMQL
jgi:hypothetical protein